MSGIVPRLQKFLDEHRVDYQVIHHRTDYRATATAADTDTEPEEFAKTVFLWIDGRFAMAVLPALKHVALSKLRRALDAEPPTLVARQCYRRLVAVAFAYDRREDALREAKALVSLPVRGPLKVEDELMLGDAIERARGPVQALMHYRRMAGRHPEPLCSAVKWRITTLESKLEESVLRHD